MVDQVKFSTKAEAAGYLAAIIDGEGSVIVRSRGPGNHRLDRHVRVANTEQSIIDATTAACGRLDIESRVLGYKASYDRWKQVHLVLITGRRNLERLHATVRLRSDAKRERLERAVTSFIDRPASPGEETLRSWYHEDHLSAVAIGARCGVSPTTVFRWLDECGIERRTKSQSQALAWDTRRQAS